MIHQVSAAERFTFRRIFNFKREKHKHLFCFFISVEDNDKVLSDTFVYKRKRQTKILQQLLSKLFLVIFKLVQNVASSENSVVADR